MTQTQYYCTRCNVTLAVAARRKLPDTCPVCECRHPPSDVLGTNLFQKVEP